jgi:hypothetical protein
VGRAYRRDPHRPLTAPALDARRAAGMILTTRVSRRTMACMTTRVGTLGAR